MNERRKRRLDHVPQYLEGSAAQQSVDAAASSSSPPSPYSRRHTSECELPSIPPVRRRLILSPEHMSPTGSTADACNKRRAAVASAREEHQPNPTPSLQGPHRPTIFTRLYLGGPDQICSHCGPRFWYEERVRGHGRTTSPVYNRCCRGGSIVLPPYSKPPAPLLALLTGKDSTLVLFKQGYYIDYCSADMPVVTLCGVQISDIYLT